MRPKLGDLVEVTWLDAWSDHETTESKDWKDECVVTTSGELRRLTDKVVSVAGERLTYGASDPDPEAFRCVTHVPAAMVVKIDVLRRAE